MHKKFPTKIGIFDGGTRNFLDARLTSIAPSTMCDETLGLIEPQVLGRLYHVLIDVNDISLSGSVSEIMRYRLEQRV